MDRLAIKALANIAPSYFHGKSCESCARALCCGLLSSTVLAIVLFAAFGDGIYSKILDRYLGFRAMFFDHSTFAVVSTDPKYETNASMVGAPNEPANGHLRRVEHAERTQARMMMVMMMCWGAAIALYRESGPFADVLELDPNDAIPM